MPLCTLSDAIEQRVLRGGAPQFTLDDLCSTGRKF